MSGPERAHEQESESIPLVAPDVGLSPAGIEGFASTQVLAMQRSAGNARVAGWFARVPAPPAGRTRDRSQVAITGPTAAIDYLAYVENNFNLRSWDYSSAPWNVSRTWRLFDAADRQVEESSGAISGAYTLFANILRDHVHRHGTGSLGTWTLRLEKDSYYDDVTFAVTQDANRPGPPLAGETTES